MYLLQGVPDIYNIFHYLARTTLDHIIKTLEEDNAWPKSDTEDFFTFPKTTARTEGKW